MGCVRILYPNKIGEILLTAFALEEMPRATVNSGVVKKQLGKAIQVRVGGLGSRGQEKSFERLRSFQYHVGEEDVDVEASAL